jgi:AbrB family looped-hinge helix DNA binding protein
VKISRKNQISVPAATRRQLAIGPGDRLDVDVRDGAIVLRPRRAMLVDELRDLAPQLWQDVDASAYIDELRDEWSDRGR